MKFEGPEKKLEVILNSPQKELRSNRTGIWDKVVESACTYILHQISNEYFDAYLLAESSLFVYADRVIMITCGKSKLYQSMPTLLNYIDPDNVKHVFYERKNFLYPEAQLCNFQDETREIASLFPGMQLRFGPQNGDRVYVYFASQGGSKTVLAAATGKRSDVTLEILMHDISPDSAQMFYYNPELSLATTRYRSGIEALFPGADIVYDDYMFDPCGYSLNAMIDHSYFTIHVTPQEICSYVSFETNVLLDDYQPLISRVLECFSPQRCTVVFIGNTDAKLWRIRPHSIFKANWHNKIDIGYGYRVRFANLQFDESYLTAYF